MKSVQVSPTTSLATVDMSEVPDPRPGPGQVLIRLEAAALNHRDLKLLAAPAERPYILGSDGAGIVEAAGPGVSGIKPGAEVIINPSLGWGAREDTYGTGWSILGAPTDGTFAELVVVPAENVHPRPPHLSWAEAAALPLAGLTAYRALFTRARVHSGERVLVHGIGGGVALFALQFARAAGARVMVTSTSDAKLVRARELGAEHGVNSRTTDWGKTARDWADGAGVDAVVESVGGELFSRSLLALRPGGRMVAFGKAIGGADVSFDVRTLYWNQLSLLGSTMGSPRDFANMLAFVTEHQLRPVVDSVRPLAEARAALQRMARGEQFGKVILTCH